MSVLDGNAEQALARTLAPPSTPGVRARLAAALQRTELAHFLVLATLLRLAVMPIATPVHPDEVFQYLETAHRLVFGQGVVTWEWRDGVRGWLLPRLVSAPMQLGAWLAPKSTLYLLLPNLTMLALSLTTVWAAWRMGERVSRLHAQVAAFVAAIWYEFVYFAPHVMSETTSIALILPAALLLTERERWTDLRLGAAAMLLANAAAIRFQHLPAIAALVVAACAFDLRRCWRPLLLGGLLGLAPSVLCDLAAGAVPFKWIFANVDINVVQGHAASVTASGPLGYLTELWPRIALWLAPLLVMAVLGARRFPAIAWMAGVNFVSHSAVAHKEYRYILLSMTVAVIFAAIGTVDWARSVTRQQGADAGRAKLHFLLVVWALASLSCAFGGFRTQWMKFRPEMVLYDRLREDPALCGVAVYRHEFSITGGYAYLHRAAPIFWFTDGDYGRPSQNLSRASAAFNTVMTQPDYAAELPAAFKEDGCDGAGDTRVCLYRRPGPCTRQSPDYTMSAVLRRLHG